MATPLRLLIAEDNPHDTELAVRELRRAGYEPEWHRVETEGDYLGHLDSGLDIILSDYAMPQFSGPRALELLKQSGLDVPFIIISGTIGEAIAVEVIKLGANDYLLKDRLVRLGQAVRQALEQAAQRRQSEKTGQELRWKTAFLEAQVNATLDGILVVDQQGRKILQNQRMSDIFNIPQDIAEDKDDQRQVRWVTAMTRYPDTFVEKVVYLYAHPEEISRDEIELKDGTVLDRYSSPVVGQDGQHYGRTWTFRDISEQKRAQEALRQSEERFAGAFELAPIGVALVAPTGRWLKVNRALCNLVGYSEAELLDLTFQDITHPPDLDADLECVRQLLAGEKRSYQMEKRYIHADGHLVTVLLNVSLVQDEGGQPLYFIAQIQDITSRLEAEKEVRFNEQRFRSLVEATTAIVWDTPASGRFEVEQPGWTAFTGQSFEELRGWGWLTAIHPDDQSETARVWSAAVASRSPYEVEHRLRARDQTYHAMAVRAVPILGEDGTIRQWIGIHADITEKKKLEQQFLRAQRMESIGTLAGGIAHDLNNVLTPIMMSIELLRLTGANESARPILTTIETSARRGADMVKQILSFARGVEGQQVMISPQQIIEEMQHLVRDTFPKNILFHADLPPDIPVFLGDHTQVHQVLLNLCVNARDAMPNGGSLTVSAQSISVDDHYAALKPDLKPGDYIRIQVADTGTGIPPEVIEKIFDPFFTTKELGKGTGLGLSTVLAIVKSHAGMLEVDSEPGQGTTFTVFFPSKITSQAKPLAIQADVNPYGQGQLILVVDDEAAVRLITQQTLEAYGYRVLLAADGAEAIAIYSMNQADVAVVLTDMMMPVMDGAATIQVLQRINPDIKIIAASGLTNSGASARTAGMGVNFLAKPYTAQTILRKLKEVLATSQLEKE